MNGATGGKFTGYRLKKGTPHVSSKHVCSLAIIIIVPISFCFQKPKLCHSSIYNLKKWTLKLL